MADAYGIPREHNDADTSIVQPVNEIIGNLTLESDVHYSQIEGIFGHQPPRVCLKCTLQRSGDRRRTLNLRLQTDAKTQTINSCRKASATACVRLRAPSFAFAFLKWLRTVSTPRLSAPAISSIVLPSEAIFNTDSSLCVKRVREIAFLIFLIFFFRRRLRHLLFSRH